MPAHNQPITIDDPAFNQLLKRVSDSNESVVIQGDNNRKAALVPLWLYENTKRARTEAKERLFVMIEELRQKNAHRSTEEIEREVDAAVEAVRHGKAHT